MMEPRTYLGVGLTRPKVAVFDFTSCEGCELQLLNNEGTLLDFLSLIEVVNFREAISERGEDYEIAFVEGSISRADEVERLKTIRSRAKTLVALGSCACFGGVAQLKNRFEDLDWVRRQVYGKSPMESEPCRPIEAEVPVDLKIYGCPISKEEVEEIVVNLALGRSIAHPEFPVCMECNQQENVCLFKLGEPCLGPITRGGCRALCPRNGAGCWGCRGPVPEPNLDQLLAILDEHGFSNEAIIDRLECFGGFASHVQMLRNRLRFGLVRSSPQATPGSALPELPTIRGADETIDPCQDA